MNRREFIYKGMMGGLMVGSAGWPLEMLAARDAIKLTILHTNDVHSHIDPFPEDHSRYPGQGGVSFRTSYIEKVRKEEDHVLLLDAGDIFQGTPYFNFFKGRVEIELMNAMGYDVATIGNHDFDAGIETLAQHTLHTKFTFVSANYDFRNTPMDGRIKPFTVLKKGPLKIGIFGLGVELKGLVPDKLFGGTVYMDPLQVAQETAGILKHDYRCDLVICLSHLGFQYQSEKISDIILASRTKYIDLIIGGHTHTFMNEPLSIPNIEGEEVLINQVGWAGLMVGRIDYFFHRNFKKNWASENTVIGPKKSRAI